jgi:Dolichyl-phosphate-mannose-protein mannosyltransferase
MHSGTGTSAAFPSVAAATPSGLRLQRWSRFAYGLTASLIIFEGVILRVHHYGRDLSIAEAWVANSVLTTSLHDMFYYQGWLQTTPPLFLLLVRAVVTVFGLSDYSLCAVPLAFGILSLLLLAALAGRMLQPPFALICLSLMVLSPAAIGFSKELKQYSADVAASTLILLALWEYLQESDLKHYFWLLLALALTLPISYIAVVFIPLFLCVLIFGYRLGRSVPTLSTIAFRSVSLLLFAATVSSLNYFLFIRPNTSPLLQDFWSGGFPPVSGAAAIVDFFAKHFLATVIHFYFPLQSAFKDTLRTMLLSLPIQLKLIGVLIGLALLIVLMRSARRNRIFQCSMLFFFIPLLTLMALNWAHLYPVSSRRLTLFLLPGVVIASAASLQVLWQTVALRIMRHLEWRPALGLLFYPLAAIVTGLLALGIQKSGWDLDESGDRGTESALRYLKSEVNAERDLIFVQAALDEPAQLYRKILGWHDAPLRTGHTGLPCCKRIPERRPTDVRQERAYVLSEFDHLVGELPEGRLWLVFWEKTRRNWLAWIKVDEPSTIIDHLYRIGCRSEFESLFEGVVVDAFKCNHSRTPTGPRSPTSYTR